jgi:hypothetical protein
MLDVAEMRVSTGKATATGQNYELGTASVFSHVTIIAIIGEADKRLIVAKGTRSPCSPPTTGWSR